MQITYTPDKSGMPNAIEIRDVTFAQNVPTPINDPLTAERIIAYIRSGKGAHLFKIEADQPKAEPKREPMKLPSKAA